MCTHRDMLGLSLHDAILLPLVILERVDGRLSFLPPLFGDLCSRDNPCVQEANCMIDPAAPIVGRPFCICPEGQINTVKECRSYF